MCYCLFITFKKFEYSMGYKGLSEPRNKQKILILIFGGKSKPQGRAVKLPINLLASFRKHLILFNVSLSLN